MAYRLSPSAQADIDQIWDCTCDRWDLDQADRYVWRLREVITDLSANPLLGRACDDIREGYFRMSAGSHVIFYRPSGADIEVVRILHGRMDLRRHLD